MRRRVLSGRRSPGTAGALLQLYDSPTCSRLGPPLPRLPLPLCLLLPAPFSAGLPSATGTTSTSTAARSNFSSLQQPHLEEQHGACEADAEFFEESDPGVVGSSSIATSARPEGEQGEEDTSFVTAVTSCHLPTRLARALI